MPSKIFISLVICLIHAYWQRDIPYQVVSVEKHETREIQHVKRQIDDSFFPPQNEVIQVVATAYIALCDSGCSGITATGYDVRNTIHTPQGRRIIAVDPNVIPLGSIVRIDGVEYRALDKGGAIKGRRIDVLVASIENARNFGTKVLNVEILEKKS